MKRRLILTVILLFGVAAIVISERRKVDVPPGPGAVLYLIADTEQELTRMPAHFTRISDADEIAIGNQLAKSYDESNRYIRDPEQSEIQNYVSSIGARVAMRAHRRLPYRFHYLRDPWLINAFALPGGHVYIGAGLLSLMDSEDELAAVLGHEIEHIDHYHCAERVQQQEALHQIPLGGLLSLPIQIFEAGYSKDQELEADREGTRLSVQAG
jgi:beta-barrel assembly-enhancing protease